jgi:hypothetical protein
MTVRREKSMGQPAMFEYRCTDPSSADMDASQTVLSLGRRILPETPTDAGVEENE